MLCVWFYVKAEPRSWGHASYSFRTCLTLDKSLNPSLPPNILWSISRMKIFNNTYILEGGVCVRVKVIIFVKRFETYEMKPTHFRLIPLLLTLVLSTRG